MGGKARTAFKLNVFVPIQPKSAPSKDPELLVKLEGVNKTIEEAKKKKEEFSVIAAELKDMNHPEAQQAENTVEQADKILANLTALRYNILDGK